MRELALDQGFRDDPDHLAAGFEGRIRDHAHQPDMAAAEDESYVGLRERSAERPGRFRVGGVDALAGAAEDADALQS